MQWGMQLGYSVAIPLEEQPLAQKEGFPLGHSARDKSGSGN